MRQFCIDERLDQIKIYKNKWNLLDNNTIEKLKLILKCFPDDSFLNTLKQTDMFGEMENGNISINLPDKAIDMGYEFFLLLKNIDELEKDETGKTYYVPQRFKDFLSIVNPLFKGITANDSKDLIICLYETWHKIYNIGNAPEHEKAVTNKVSKNGDQEFILFYKSYFTQNASIFTDTFYWVQGGRMHCDNCNFDKASYNIQNIFIFPLGKTYVYKFQLKNKINTVQKQLNGITNQILSYQQNYAVHQSQLKLHSLQHQMLLMMSPESKADAVALKQLENDICRLQTAMDSKVSLLSQEQLNIYNAQKEISNILTDKKKTVTVKDLFLCYSEPNLLTVQNQIYCNNCHNLVDGTTVNYVLSLPEKMTMIFNRGKGLQFDINVEHADYIDPFDVLDFNANNDQCFQRINVRANLLHLGSSSMSGHFISAIRSGKDNKPRTYNDSIVNHRNEMKLGKSLMSMATRKYLIYGLLIQ